ncbi:hypothetical protein [Streptomyces albidus (ex Kaewkla and Franco 2022)]|uniref:hypothetical protein n=1 Tax=Streptomyces albidus (ex Kaewkla and Franco 2022) TaxID=722709 RepID=UPI0015EFBAD8|nr:hypothetical protein [Streptomyces albidus (ex Kaewkla and Franco 2022)]
MTLTTKIRRKTLVRGATALAAGVLIAGGLAVTATAGEADNKDHRANAQLLDEKCAVPPDFDAAIINTVHDVASQRGVNEKVMLAAFETGWVESHMNNLNCGDRDSLGVFQQRPSAGWGTPEQILDPVYATNAFLDQAIPNDQNNPGFTAGELAQSVQRSAFPDRYDESEGKAREMIAAAQAG